MNYTEASQLETYIRASYDRLHHRASVYLLRNHDSGYGDLPDPDSASTIYKASVLAIPGDYVHGVKIVDWHGMDERPTPDDEQFSGYRVSPRELFLTKEMLAVLRDHTKLPYPRPAKLNQRLESKSGKFSAILATAMAEVVLERFQHDPRDNGRLLVKR